MVEKKDTSAPITVVAQNEVNRTIEAAELLTEILSDGADQLASNSLQEKPQLSLVTTDHEDTRIKLMNFLTKGADTQDAVLRMTERIYVTSKTDLSFVLQLFEAALEDPNAKVKIPRPVTDVRRKPVKKFLGTTWVDEQFTVNEADIRAALEEKARLSENTQTLSQYGLTPVVREIIRSDEFKPLVELTIYYLKFALYADDQLERTKAQIHRHVQRRSEIATGTKKDISEAANAAELYQQLMKVADDAMRGISINGEDIANEDMAHSLKVMRNAHEKVDIHEKNANQASGEYIKYAEYAKRVAMDLMNYVKREPIFAQLNRQLLRNTQLLLMSMDAATDCAEAVRTLLFELVESVSTEQMNQLKQLHESDKPRIESHVIEIMEKTARFAKRIGAVVPEEKIQAFLESGSKQNTGGSE
jgi:hypothetical protein